MDGFLTDETVDEVRRILSDETYRRKVVDYNYEVATRFFSYRRVQDELLAILAKPVLAPPGPKRSERETE
jgi:hypothetical protein